MKRIYIYSKNGHEDAGPWSPDRLATIRTHVRMKNEEHKALNNGELLDELKFIETESFPPAGQKFDSEKGELRQNTENENLVEGLLKPADFIQLVAGRILQKYKAAHLKVHSANFTCEEEADGWSEKANQAKIWKGLIDSGADQTTMDSYRLQCIMLVTEASTRFSSGESPTEDQVTDLANRILSAKERFERFNAACTGIKDAAIKQLLSLPTSNLNTLYTSAKAIEDAVEFPEGAQ